MKRNILCIIAAICLAGSVISMRASTPTINTLTQDGAWCWFADPRAVYHEGTKKQTYITWVTSIGDIVVASFNHDTHQYQQTTIHAQLEADDHDVPALLIREDGHIIVFYSKHQAAGPMNRVISTLPEDISSFSPLFSWGTNVSYPNPFQVGNQIHMFYRGVNWHPTIAISKDNGMTFTDIRQLVLNGGARPYARYCQGADGSIHVAVTTGHPRNEAQNKIFYFRLKDNKFYRADGSLIKEFSTGIDLGDNSGRYSEAEAVYNGIDNGRGWIWDIAIDPKTQHPILLFASFPTESDHRYNYAYWDGNAWQCKEIVKAGKWFPQTPPGTTEKEPHYSGGLSLDYQNPSIVYLSKQVNGVFEIFKYETPDWGTSWTSTPITQNTPSDIVNVRPIVPRNHQPGYFDVLWMRGTYEYYYKKYNTAIVFPEGNFSQEALLTLPSKEEIITTATSVNNKWIGSNPDPGNNLWARATYHIGNIDLYKVYPENRYLEYATKWATKHNWSINHGITTPDADNHTAGQTYIDLYLLDKEPDEKKITPITNALNHRITANPNSDEWWWIDAIFMAMPTFARLGVVHDDVRFFDKMHALYSNLRNHLVVNSANTRMWPSTFRQKYGDGPILPLHEEFDAFRQREGAYNPTDRLWWRDWGFQPNVPPKKSPATNWSTDVPKVSPNGKNIYWSRGNGWVIAAMARTLQFLPLTHPYRSEYAAMLQNMAAALKECQRTDGFWNMNLADPLHYPAPETSGTALMTYAIAWGINNDLLDRKTFIPVVAKAWNGLTSIAIQPDGTVKYTQNVGEAPIDPKGLTSSSVDFGVGAVLLAASEVVKLAQGTMPIPEMKPLTITSIVATDDTHLKVTFAEELDLPSATDPTNYSLPHYNITAASADAPSSIILSLNSPLPYGRYELTVSEVFNLSSTAKTTGKPTPYVHFVPLDTPSSGITLTASTYQNDSQYKGYPSNAADNDLTTRWAAEGKGAWLKIDLSETTDVWAVDIAFHDGNKRISYFNIDLSTDDITYSSATTGPTSGRTLEMERYSFTSQRARYIKITCQGNSLSNWNSITELRIRTGKPTSSDAIFSDRTIRIYPNPVTTDNLTIRLSPDINHPVAVSISDIAGKTLIAQTTPMTQGVASLPLTTLPAGIYILSLTEGGITHHIRFLKSDS